MTMPSPARRALVIDLAELIEDPALRWGFGADAARLLRPDGLRPGELDDPPAHVRDRAGETWWAATRALADAAPEHFVVARDQHDVLQGVAIAATPRGASPAALADPFLGRWLEHARDHVPDGNALVWRDALDLTADEEGDLASRVLAVINTATILRSGLPNPRCFYLPISPVNTASVAFARQSGARKIEGLDVLVGSVVHECHVIDHGPGGVLGGLRATIYAELGLPRSAADEPKVAGRAAAVTEADVRQALRDIDRPSQLMASPLAALVDVAAGHHDRGRRPHAAARRDRRRPSARVATRSCCAMSRSVPTTTRARRTRTSPTRCTSAARPTSAACARPTSASATTCSRRPRRAPAEATGTAQAASRIGASCTVAPPNSKRSSATVCVSRTTSTRTPHGRSWTRSTAPGWRRRRRWISRACSRVSSASMAKMIGRIAEDLMCVA